MSLAKFLIGAEGVAAGFEYIDEFTGKRAVTPPGFGELLLDGLVGREFGLERGELVEHGLKGLAGGLPFGCSSGRESALISFAGL